MSNFTEEQRESLTGCAIALVGLALIPFSVCWNGYVFQTIWNWYAAPFTPVRLTIPMAIGLSCLISTIKGYKYDPSKWSTGEKISRMVWVFLAPGMVLLVGAIAHHFAVSA